MFSPRAPRFEPPTLWQLRWIALAGVLVALAPPPRAATLAARDDRADPRPPGSALLYEDVLDLARADAADLESLPGVGPARAHALLAARARGEVRSLDDARDALRMSDAEWRRIAPRVSLRQSPG